MKKKAIIIMCTTIILLTLGVSYAYFTGKVVGNNKEVSITSKELKIVFTDDRELAKDNIEPGWKESKTFSVTNESDKVFNYNIVFENLVNTFVTEGFLQYKITSTDGGYTMEDYVDIPKQPSVDNSKDVILAYDIDIPVGKTHNYTIELVYLPSDTVDQSDDMGKILSGNLAIIEGTADPSVKYTVTMNIQNGTVDNLKQETIKYGSLSYIVTPDTGYDITKMNVSCPQAEATIEGNTVIVNNIQQTQNCNVTFDKVKYALTLNVVNGTSDKINVSVPHGESEIFNITPNENYVLSDTGITCTGSTTHSINGNTVTIGNIVEETTCIVTLELKTYKVDINVTNGRSNAENKIISHGGSGTATITPDTGYTLVGSTVTGDGCSLDETSGILTIDNVVKAGTCNITLVKEKYSVSLSGTNVIVTGSPKQVPYKENITFDVTLNDGYVLTDATVECNGGVTTSIDTNNNRITINNVTQSITCTVTPVQLTYKVTITVTNGKSTVVDKTVSHGSNVEAIITPNTGYTLENATVTGSGCSLNETTGVLTVSNVVSVRSCSITLKKQKYSVSMSGSNVTVSESPKEVEYQSDVTFSVTPGIGFTLSNATVNCNGLTSSNITVGSNQVTLKNITQTTSCTIEPKQLTYEVTLTVVNGLGNDKKTITHGSNGEFTISANTGYTLVSPTITCTGSAGTSISGSVVTISNVTAVQTCTVTLKKQKYTVNVTVSGGSSNPTSASIEHGENGTFSISANTNNNLSASTVSGEGCKLSEDKKILTVSNVTGIRSCTVTIPLKQYTASVTVSGGTAKYGSNAASSSVSYTLNHGSSPTFTIAANSSNNLSGASVTGSGCNLNSSKNTLTISSMSGNVSCEVTIPLKQYTVTPSVTGGSSSPQSSTVSHGESGTFTISASTGRNLSGATVSGANCSLSTDKKTLTASNVISNRSCNVSIPWYQYKATVNVSGGTAKYGSEASSAKVEKTVDYNTSPTFTITASDSSYNLAGATVSPTSGCTLSSDKTTLTMSSMKADRTCTITIPKKTYTVIVSSNNTSMGTVSVSSNSVTYGGSVTITLSPNAGYIYDSDNCGGTRSGNTITISNIIATKLCTVTFKVDNTLASVLKKAYPSSGERTSFNSIYTTTALHTATDYDGSTTYYFTGNPNNWVSFAGKLWRVIRINGDGSVRLLYAGTGGEDGYIGKSAFNSIGNSPTYVGWKYTLGNPDTLSTSRGNGTPSTIYTYIKTNWFDLLTTGQKSYINTSAVYCNDRNTSYSGINNVNFPFYNRVLNRQAPTYGCEVGDRFQDGFGLMTSDEVIFAGGIRTDSTSASFPLYYYLNASGGSLTGMNYWWTMTPNNYTNYAGASAGYVGGSSDRGIFLSYAVTKESAVRPVVSLKSCVTVSPDGDGSGTNPYVVNGTC